MYANKIDDVSKYLNFIYQHSV